MMTILSEQFVIDALQSIEQFPIDFDDVWKEYGYNQFSDAKRYLIIRSGLKPFNHNTSSRLPVAYLKKSKDKIYLSYESFKFSLARANTLEGENCLIHLIEVERKYRADLELKFLTPSVDDSAKIFELKQRTEELQKDLAEVKQQFYDYQAQTVKKIETLECWVEWYKRHPEMTLQEHIGEVMCYFVNLVSDPKDTEKLKEFQDFAKTYKYPGEGLIKFNPNNPGESLAEDAWYSRFLRAKAGVMKKLIKVFQQTAVEECLCASCYGLEGSYTERGRKAYEKEILIYKHLLQVMDKEKN